MITFLDFETTFQINEKKQTDPSPYDPRNYVVSAGWKSGSKDTGILYQFYKHNTARCTDLTALTLDINETTLLVAFNAKFELAWLKALGIEYKGKIADPMIREYVLNKGQKFSVSLEESCKRNNVTLKKSELVQDYLKKGIGFEAMPWEIVQEYGSGDIESLKALYYNQIERLNAEPHLWPTVNLMEEFCRCLTDIEWNGIKIDVIELERLEKEYRTEFNELEIKLNTIIAQVMGDTKINLSSPEQLSQLLYSRKVIDKPKWKEVFNLGTEVRGSVVKPKRQTKMDKVSFVNYVRTLTTPIYKTRMEHCERCGGQGYSTKILQSGKEAKKPTRCISCMGLGYCYQALSDIGGFKFIPTEKDEVSVGGFGVSKECIEKLHSSATGIAKEFIEYLKRYGAISIYLETFIDGIRRAVRDDGLLHHSFMQCVTATGRLSSRYPNFHNQPRGNTFPVRRAIVSRWEGGLILSGDAKQLEFRIAGELSGDKQIFEDVTAGIDVHSATAKWTGLSRQDSKPHTFAPVYGAVPEGKPEHIAAYYSYFQKHYRELAEAHILWANTVLSSGGCFRLPSGREFYYPNTVRYKNGTISNSTIIKNYPVQGFATADIIPIYCINTWKLFIQYGLKSLLINEVHDDVTADVYPGELEIAAKLMVQAFHSIYEEAEKRWNYKIKMPLEVELKVGPNWLDQKEYIT